MEDPELERIRKHLFTSVKSTARLTGHEEMEVNELAVRYRESFNEPLPNVIKRAGFKSIIDAANHPESKFITERSFDNKLIVRVERAQGLNNFLTNQIVSEIVEKEQKKADKKRKSQKGFNKYQREQSTGFSSLNSQRDQSTRFASLNTQPVPSIIVSPVKKPKSMTAARPPKVFRHATSPSDSEVLGVDKTSRKPIVQSVKKEATQSKDISVKSNSGAESSISEDDVRKKPAQLVTKEVTQSKSAAPVDSDSSISDSSVEVRKPVKVVDKEVIQLKKVSPADSGSSSSGDEVHKPKVNSAPINRVPIDTSDSSELTATEKPAKQLKEAPGEKNSFGHRDSSFYVKVVKSATKKDPKARQISRDDSNNGQATEKPEVNNSFDHSSELGRPTPSINSNFTMAIQGWEDLLHLELGRELMENSENAGEIIKLMPLVKRIMKTVFKKAGFPAEK